MQILILLLGLLIATGCDTKQPPITEVAASALKSEVPVTATDSRTALPDSTPPPVTVRKLPSAPNPGTVAQRSGDEIVVAGQFIHTGTPVVLWLDAGGYDAYRVERRFSPLAQSSWQATQESGAGLDSPNRYDTRHGALTEEERERVRGGGWDLPTLQRCIDQFVIHYDVAGTSRQCFKVLHDNRDLSVHFLLDLDGTLYQTLDVKERARHASGANDRSIGIEIANIGAYPPDATDPLDEWYQRDSDGTRITIPARFGDGSLRAADFDARPARMEAVTNTIQGQTLVQYDFTPAQYNALAHLTAALCRVLPQIRCDAPRDAAGEVPAEKLADEALANFHGVLGHYHLTTNKVDPGPAFQWDKLLGEARRLLNEPPRDQSSKPDEPVRTE